MTDQNTAYRSDLDSVDESDPLAELARIVSGEAAPEKEAAAPVELEVVKSAPASDGFDIESELLKELGEAPAESAPVTDAAASSGDIDLEISDDDFTAELQLETEAATNALATDDTPSLEDQLMAELGGEEISAPVPEKISETNALVDETVSNAMRDVELASESLEHDSDPFDQVDQLTSEIQREASVENAAPAEMADASNSQNPDNIDDFFAEGFEDLLQEEITSSNAASVPVEGTGEPDFDFAAAFDSELESDNAAANVEKAHPVNTPPHQDELALENEFAKAFASELSGDQTTFPSEVSQGHDDQSAAGAAFFDPSLSANDPINPQVASIMPEEAAMAGRSGNGFKLAIGALICALVVGLGVVGWGYYSGQDGSGAPRIVKADAQPSKVKPKDPGGEEIANQDNEVYSQVAGNAASEPTQEELISSRQKPVDIQPKSDSRLAPGAERAATETAPLGLSPKRVKTLTVKPDGTIITSSGEVAASTEPVIAASEDTAALTPVDVNASSGTEQGTIGIDGASSTGKLGVPEPSPLPAAKELALVQAPVTPKPVAAAPAKPVAPAPKPAAQPAADTNAPMQIASLDNSPAPIPVATSSEWKIQVSSQRSRDAAEASFNNLQRRFSSILGGRSAVIQRADIDGKGTFYRAKVLAESKTEASKLCARLKSAGGSCFVTR